MSGLSLFPICSRSRSPGRCFSESFVKDPGPGHIVLVNRSSSESGYCTSVSNDAHDNFDTRGANIDTCDEVFTEETPLQSHIPLRIL